jgi:ABC-2 type transport system permease protein
MNIRFILHDVYASTKQWLRSIGTVFWTLLFPVLLIMIFGAIFSDIGDVEYDIVLQDLDETSTSETFADILRNEIDSLNVQLIDSEQNITEYMSENNIIVGLQIPQGFEDTVQTSFHDENISMNLSFYFDPSEQSTVFTIKTILATVLNKYNMGLTQGRDVIGMEDVGTLEEFDYIDFFVPGMIGFTIMTSMIYGSIERNTKYRKAGILRKLLTMPITRADWILSKMLFMLILSFISTSVILLVGVLVWGLHLQINIFFFILIISTSFLFSGMGMIIGRFVKEEETADMAGGAITFPMMFLAGTFFPLDQMPEFLQTFAQALPLYYVNEGLRNAMIYADLDKTMYFTAFVLAFALIFFIIGVVFTKWKED